MSIFGRARHLLFDIPVSPERLGKLVFLLNVALSETATEDEFERHLQRLVQRAYRTEGVEGWGFVTEQLDQYRRGLEVGVSLRTLAQRLVADPPLPLARKPLTLPDLQRNRVVGLIPMALIYILVAVAVCALAGAFMSHAFPMDWP